jgi:hypothetical protein
MNEDATQRPIQKKDMANWKPGSESKQAKDVIAPDDFGVPVGSGPSRDRDYVTNNTRKSDPGATQPADWEEIGVRDHGAGGPAGGPGSSSAGDLDPDIVGVGTGGSGIAQAGPGGPAGPDDGNDASDAFASGGPRSTNRRASDKNRPARVPQSRGSSINGDLDMQTGSGGQGADAATNSTARGDDSFAGEISSGEARGDDLPFNEPPNAQGGSDEDEL